VLDNVKWTAEDFDNSLESLIKFRDSLNDLLSEITKTDQDRADSHEIITAIGATAGIAGLLFSLLRR